MNRQYFRIEKGLTPALKVKVDSLLIHTDEALGTPYNLGSSLTLNLTKYLQMLGMGGYENENLPGKQNK